MILMIAFTTVAMIIISNFFFSFERVEAKQFLYEGDAFVSYLT